MKLLMDKQLCDNGYTFIEMLLVIYILVIMLSGGLYIYLNSIKLQYQMKILQQLFLQAQVQAYHEKNQIDIKVEYSGVWIAKQYHEFFSGISCTPYSFHYAATGNISKGGTLQCQILTKQKKLVMQVGSGQIDIR